jgi:hypothetical protein
VAVAELAERQHGMVSTAQLHGAGFGRGAIHHRVLRGRLHPYHRGVYAVGHTRVTWRGRLWAALLAFGGPDDATLSHRTAAATWDLLPPPAGPIDVTTLHGGRSVDGVRVHRPYAWDPELDVARDAEGLARTSVTRTLVDLAAILPPHQLARVCDRADLLRILDAAAVLERVAGRRGARALRAAVGRLAATEPAVTRSELEERFLALVDRAGLPRPLVNARAEAYEVDFLWPAAKLVVETDGAAAHLTPAAFERDRERDAGLMLAGFQVVRFTWRRVVQQPRRVAETVAGLIRGSSSG